MIDSVALENFQSHAGTTIDLHPGVNVIIGSSDSGKTAIIRALRWACQNKPSGDGMRSDWGGDTKVVVSLDDGYSITRSRTNSDNKYKISPSEGDGEFASFKTGVPDQVSSLLNMNDLNWQLQHDMPFMLSSNGGDVARTLNEIVHLDPIDRGLTNVNSKIRSISASIKSIQDSEADDRAELEKYDELGGLDKRVTAAEELELDANRTAIELQTLRSAISSLENINRSLAAHAVITCNEKSISCFEGLAELAADSRTRRDTLIKLRVDLKLATDSLASTQLMTRHDASLKTAEDIGLKTDKAYEQWDKIKGLADKIKSADSAISAQSEVVRKLMDDWNANKPDTCPTCERIWPSERQNDESDSHTDI